jgi:hypothetical protein
MALQRNIKWGNPQRIGKTVNYQIFVTKNINQNGEDG